MKTKLYYPDRALQFRKIETIIRSIMDRKKGGKFAELVNDGVSETEAFKVAFYRMFPETKKLVPWYRDIHDRFRYLRFDNEDALVIVDIAERNLDFTIDTIMSTVYTQFPQYQEAFDIHDGVKAYTSVFDLVRDASTFQTDISRSNQLERRSVRDARMVCASLFQYMLVELTEPRSAVKQSLQEIQRIMRERFFDPHILREFYIVSVRDANNHNRIMGTCNDICCHDEPQIFLFDTHEQALVMAQQLQARGLDVIAEILPWYCRAVNIDGVWYYFYHTRRAKEPGSSTRKLASGRKLSDRRGYRLAVMAKEVDGVLTLATRDDVEKLTEHLLDTVWMPKDTPFVLEELEPRQHNKFNGVHFHHDQLKGRHIYQVGDRMVAGAVEMSLQTLADYLNGSRPGTPEYHGTRRRRQILEGVMRQRYSHIDFDLIS
ncbi:MAG: hypothetical protein ABH826_01595 [Patescibacteria group bacterium]|nr:hypothetical protein [Patescibacteria group bacterium]